MEERGYVVTGRYYFAQLTITIGWDGFMRGMGAVT
jgi:hypothetical protein